MVRQPDTSNAEPLVLLTGATGYVGGRLLPALESSGVRLRCLARRPENLAGRVAASTEIVRGDLLDAASLVAALSGVRTAYYLVHSMGSAGDFRTEDRIAAENFGRAAVQAGVERVIYLGGLGDSSTELSSHLQSRQEVGDVLRASGVKVLELRASIVIGSGSLSFEMIRALVERLPVMITPRWVDARAQPIAIDDLLAYLLAARDLPLAASRTFGIGGADRLSYGQLMREYARQRGLRRWMIRVPVLTPRLSSLWLGLVTPLYARIGRKLIESIRHDTIVSDQFALEAFSIRPVTAARAIEDALRTEDQHWARTRWCDSISSSGLPVRRQEGPEGVRLEDRRSLWVDAPREAAFAPIRRIGGTNGWYSSNWMWKLRGFIDLLCGGVGVRRGRADPDQLRVGDPLDFWRVEAFEPGRLLRLRAEMKLPGRAWLQFDVVDQARGTEIRQTASFDPHGLAGRLYWYALVPLHTWIFGRMLREIARRARVEAAGQS